jgi:hypothetical protein
LLADGGPSAGTCPEPFDADRDYLTHIDGKLRDVGVRDLLRARGMGAPEAAPDGPPGEWSVQGIGRRKQALVERALTAGDIEAFPGVGPLGARTAWRRHPDRGRVVEH